MKGSTTMNTTQQTVTVRTTGSGFSYIHIVDVDVVRPEPGVVAMFQPLCGGVYYATVVEATDGDHTCPACARRSN